MFIPERDLTMSIAPQLAIRLIHKMQLITKMTKKKNLKKSLDSKSFFLQLKLKIIL